MAMMTACQPPRERYRIIMERSVIMKIDTETGQSWCWVANYNGGGGTWKAIPTDAVISKPANTFRLALVPAPDN